MKSRSREPVPPSVPEACRDLGALGVEPLEELAYLRLLGQERASVEEIAQWIGQSASRVRALLSGMEAKGLVSPSSESGEHFIASLPEFALEALFRQRQADLERCRAAIPKLTKLAERPSALKGNSSFIEIIKDRSTQKKIVCELIESIRSEGVAFLRGPMMFPHTPSPHLPSKGSLRSIVDEGYLTSGAGWEEFQLDIANGEDVRSCPELPMKMIIVDRRMAGIHSQNADDPLVLIRPSPLLDALITLFELMWERSTPIASSWIAKSGEAGHGKESEMSLVSMLSAGMSDKVIAYQMGISYTSLTRRLGKLMKQLDARTRFQLGWQAAIKFSKENIGS